MSLEKNKKVADALNLVDFRGLKISLASPIDIENWSYGEVTKPETMNYRTLKPEKDGLFDERIFGPTKDWECYCGKYKRIRYRGIVCDKCGVEVTLSRVRRERMGHIKLATPIAHVWFFKGAPSKLSLLLDIYPRDLEAIIYFAKYLVTKISEDKKKIALEKIADNKKKALLNLEKEGKGKEKELELELKKKADEVKKKIKAKEQLDITLAELEFSKKQKIAIMHDGLVMEKQKLTEEYEALISLVKNLRKSSLLTEEEYIRLAEHEATSFFDIDMGASALLSVISELNIDEVTSQLRLEIQKSTGQRHVKAVKRLRVIEGMKRAGISPAWMILTDLPVIPPDLRPMVQLTGGRFATSDLNDLYRRVINRNNRLKHLISLGAPEIILRNEKRMLQESVDSLIDATQRPASRVIGAPLRSLSDMLRGKQGRFRQNLLGKRVDYSGRSVIVVGPELKLNQCGLPKEMALEIFKPFVLREVISRGFAPNVKSAKHFIERRPPEVFDILDEITHNHPVLLNRAPTLHKLGIQSFYPILIEGSAIRIHPCVCAGYNADFDGDQMAVHVVLSQQAKEEAINLMMPNHNLLKPADGSPVTLPNKEMALGIFYLTSFGEEMTPKIFAKAAEALLAYQAKKIGLRTPIKARISDKILDTSVGRILFNETLPEELRFINRPIAASNIKEIVVEVLDRFGQERTVNLIDDIKDLGFWAATVSGISVSLFDNQELADKDKLIAQAEKKVIEVEENWQKGLITQEEKKRLSNEIWLDITDEIANLTWQNFKDNNPVKIIIDSGGARAGKEQLKQLSAMRGLVVDPLGKIVELPTKSNFREGLSIFEYVTSTRGSRKGLTDSALKTADAGYLTRRLIDVAHDVIIRSPDCKTSQGIEITRVDKTRQVGFEERILGRILAEKIAVKSGRKKKTILEKGLELNEEAVALLGQYKIDSVKVRSPLICELKFGICAACYGWDFSVNKMVEIGTPVGIIAAQSIGEPGTQLTMRVRHFGGVVMSDVTQGLPRVEEVFEARIPKILAPITEISGKVQINEIEDGYKIRVRSTNIKPPEEREYFVPKTAQLQVKEEDQIFAGQQLSEGQLDIKEVLSIRGLTEAQKYIINEVQAVYESQGIPINDKHFEIIVRKMSDKVQLDTTGDTTFLPGELVDKVRFEKENANVLAEGGEPSTAHRIILGITRASLYTDSWLSAASFQETTQILTDAAIFGKEDYLLGLKENVIIGRLIPTSPERAQIEE